MSSKSINITLGTAGHIDHGKTALIRNLTGCETDRLKEEKERGMSIELGFAPCQLGDLQVGIVDVPGHENFIRTMVAGASGMDGVIFVVAADDGPMPQTREHLDILTLLDVRHGVVALTKIDRVSPEELELAQSVLKDFLRGTFLESAPVIPVSNVNGEGFGDLHEALRELVGRMPPRPVDGVFRLPIERTFSVKGYGTVVTGVPLAGSARLDEEIVLLPQGITGRIKTIQVYGHDSDTVLAGQCAAINVRHWDHAVIGRGDTITVPGYFEPQSWCVCRLQLLPHERLFLKNGGTVKFHTGTSERVARVYLLEGERLVAGESTLVQIRCEEPLIGGPRDRFIVRTLSPVQTIGGGMIVEMLAGRRKRTEAGVREEFIVRAATVEQDASFVEYAVRRAEAVIATEAELARRVKLPRDRVAMLLGELLRAGRVRKTPEGWIHQQVADELCGRVLDAMAAYHRDTPESPGMTIDLLRQSVACPREALDAVVGWMRSRGQVVERNQRLALAEHQACFQSEDARLSDQIEGLFRERAFNPPEVDELPVLIGVSAEKGRALVKLLVEHGRLMRLPEGIFFHREAVDRAREILVAFIRKEGQLESVKFKYLLDTSRKFALPLLDYFDRTGVTRRANNTRYLKAPYAGGS